MHRLLHVLGHDDAAVGLADDVRSLQPAEKALELLLDAVRELAGVGDEDAPRQRVVLELRGQVRRDEVGPCLGVGHDHDLGRTCDSVDANRAEHLLLGERHVDVAGARDDVDSRDARCPVGERRDGLRPADPVDSIHAGDVRRGEDRRRNGAIGSWRRGQHDLGHPGHARRNHRHEHRRRIRRTAARRVNTRAPDGTRHELEARQSH